LGNVTISSGTSNIQTNVANATGVLLEANGGTGTTTGYYGFKNRIINGAMVIDQRNAGASKTTNDVYTVDRWAFYASQPTKFTWGQNLNSVTPPVGFSNYFGFQSSSSYSVISSDYFQWIQQIEGFNTADLAWGTANAKTVTLSFLVYSSLTGTFAGGVMNSASNRSYPFTFSIPTANTWTQISVTIAGDTTGTWVGGTNGIGVSVRFNLGAGSNFQSTANTWGATGAFSVSGAVNVVGTNGATFYITGVQLEKGSTATSFDYRPYGTELALCQRYAQVYGSGVAYERLGMGLGVSTTAVNFTFPLNVTMRASPSVSSTGSYALYNGAAVIAGTTFSIDAASVSVLAILLSATGVISGSPYQVLNNNASTSRFTLSAEL